ncbi:MAG: TlpA disulfide reductase family protein [Candidatus Nanoarchaeia archaeon]
MKKTLLFALAAFFSIFFKSFSLEPGSNAPEIQVEKWMKGGPITIREGKDKIIYVIEFWATWCPPCEISLPLLSSIQKENADNGVVVISISTEKETVIADFLSKHPDITHAVGMDMEGKTYAAYMANDCAIPMTFIVGKDGELLWKGHPMELGRVLTAILDDTFDLAKEKKIAVLRTKLQNAMHIQNDEEIKKNAYEILELDPFDELALRMLLFQFENKNELDKALEFLEAHQKKNGIKLQTSILKLGLMAQTGKDRNEIRKEANKAIESFNQNAKDLNALARFIIDELPLEKQPLDVALEASKCSIKLLPENTKNSQRVACHSTLARVLYSIGQIESAVIEQEKSLKYAKDEVETKKLNEILDFYKEILSLKNNKNNPAEYQ